jgi:hypothetical protein
MEKKWPNVAVPMTKLIVYVLKKNFRQKIGQNRQK